MDLEVHFVHLTPEGGLGAVLGVFFDREEGGNYHNDFLDSLRLEDLPKPEEEKKEEEKRDSGERKN